MEKDKWIWMPHAGHFILGNECQFRLCTYVGKYIVSTVGELWNDEIVRRIHAEAHDKEWYRENEALKGDDFSHAYFKKFGFQEIGYDRKYETMVFEAEKNIKRCKACKYVMKNTSNLDFDAYNTAGEAYKGHIKMCNKWSKK